MRECTPGRRILGGRLAPEYAARLRAIVAQRTVTRTAMTLGVSRNTIEELVSGGSVFEMTAAKVARAIDALEGAQP